KARQRCTGLNLIYYKRHLSSYLHHIETPPLLIPPCARHYSFPRKMPSLKEIIYNTDGKHFLSPPQEV
ncbi:hypothetical protein, partial [Neisseria meningitidis]|uniref:hypothetical protein n=2 Tax=Neisseria meningitidis TaxID=487 RepID=UPI001C7DB68B